MSKKNKVLPTAPSAVKNNATINKPIAKVVPNKQVEILQEISAPQTNTIKWISLLMVALVAFFTFSNSIQNTFVLDDHGIIKANKITKSGITASNLKTIFTTSHRAGDLSDLEHSLYRPVAKAIFAAEWQIKDGDQHFFHLVNVLFYVITCVVLFLVLYHAFKKNWVLALSISILFAVHPIHSETVANIKSLDEILGTLGVLLALRCCQIYVNNNNIIFPILAFLAYSFGIFGKESVIVAVAIVPLFLYYFSNANKKQIIICTTSIVAGAILFLVCRQMAIGWFLEKSVKPPSALDNVLALTIIDPNKAAGFFKGNIHYGDYIATVVYIMGEYLLKLFVPNPLSCDYSYASIMPATLTDTKFLAALAIYLGLIFFAFKTFKNKNIVGFGILWFIIASSIISNLFILFGTSFGERLMFLPSIGWCIAVVGVFYYLLKYYKINIQHYSFAKGISKHAILFAVTGIVGFVFAGLARQRNADWKTDYNLFSKDVQNFPNSTHLLFYWGNHLSSTEYAEGKSEADVKQANINALETFKKSLSLYPALPSDGYNQYGKSYYNLGYMDSAYKYYLKAHNEDSTNSVFMNNIGTIYFQFAGPKQRPDYLDSAKKFFQLAYDRDSTVIDYQNNLGAIYGTMQNRLEAIKWFEKGFKTDSTSQGAILSLKSIAVTYRDMGDSNKMKAYTEKANALIKYRQDLLAAKQAE